MFKILFVILSVFGGSAFAADHSAAITAATTEASGNYTAAIAAVIGVAVLGLGINAIINVFKK